MECYMKGISHPSITLLQSSSSFLIIIIQFGEYGVGVMYEFIIVDLYI